MAAEYRTSFKAYAAWNYQGEIDDLNRASEQGWQLVKGGCFHSRFVKDPGVRYRYQLDYGKIGDMPRYLETFREQGWEYVNSTWNGWHYLRKLYDPSLPEEEYEIFTDRESLREMNGRWVRLALAFGIILLAFAVLYLIQLIRTPQLFTLVRVLIFGIESAILLRGAVVMRNPDSGRRRVNTNLAVFIAVILIGLVAGSVLQLARPGFQTNQQASEIDAPIVDNRWADFQVYYPDLYYLDLEMESRDPMTFAVVNEAGETVYSVTDTDFSEEDIALRLPRGQYEVSMSCESGYRVDCTIR